MGYDRPMSFDETFRAIRQWDWRIILAFSIECLIMASPLLILGGSYYGLR